MSSPQITILSESVIREVLPMPLAIEINRQAFVALATQQATVPTRVILSHPEIQGATLFKPAHVAAPGITGLGLKVAGVRPRNAEQGLPTVPALILLNDVTTCMPTGLMDATYLTALRTAAGSGAATELLAHVDASRLVVFGAGLQGKAHVEAMCAVRKITHVTLWNRSPERAHQLAKELKDSKNEVVAKAEYHVAVTDEEVSQAVSQADIIVTATNSSTPVLKGADLKPGVHINAIGAYTPGMQELDSETIRRAISVSDNLPKDILNGTGDYLVPLKAGVIKEDCIVGTIGEALIGQVKVRTSPEQITLFKSVGNAAQDIATAAAALQRAKEKGLGQVCDL